MHWMIKKNVTFRISSAHLELSLYFEFFQRCYPWNSSADSGSTKTNVKNIYKRDSGVELLNEHPPQELVPTGLFLQFNEISHRCFHLLPK